jgi:quercetin dioxygenase-like cupin family protein
MKLHEKIKKIRENLGLSIPDVSNNIIKVFGDQKAISYRTIYRIENGHIAKFSSVLKICCALGVTLEELLKDTELEDRLVIRKNERIDEYTYSEKVHASVISSPTRSFLALELTLDPGGKTQIKQSPLDGHFEKLIYVIEGELTCFVGEEKHVLKSKDSLSFNSAIAHHLENNGKKTCLCTVLQNPKHF